MIHPTVSDRLATIQALCRQHRPARLELFGSAVTGRFDPATSDIDFLVEFAPLEPRELAQAYFGLLLGLEDLFGRRIDLVTTSAIRNRYFLEAIEPERTLLYAAWGAQAVAGCLGRCAIWRPSFAR